MSDVAIDVVLDFSDQTAWDDYVENHPEGRFSQLFGYRCLQNVYGYKPFYIGFLKNGRLVGALPMFEARSALLGRRFISQPFSEYGGLLVDADIKDDDRDRMLVGLEELMKRRRIDILEIHGNSGFSANDSKFRYEIPQEAAILRLDKPVIELWESVVSRHVRKAVRKAERDGLTIRFDHTEEAIRDHFYPLYLHSIKRLGSIPHPLSYFLECFRAFGDKQQFVWAIKDGRPIACLLGFACGNRISITNIVSDEKFWTARPNDLVHWEYIKLACNSGVQYFDFGSVRYGGQSQYKKKWGCSLEASGYYFLNLSSKQGKVRTFDSSGSAASAAGRLWSKVMPSWGARLVGPLLRRHLMR